MESAPGWSWSERIPALSQERGLIHCSWLSSKHQPLQPGTIVYYCVVSNICINSMSDTRSGVYTIIHCPQGPQPPLPLPLLPSNAQFPVFIMTLVKSLKAAEKWHKLWSSLVAASTHHTNCVINGKKMFSKSQHLKNF